MALADLMQTPPNLRRGNARKRCGICRHYSGGPKGKKGKCRLYGGYAVGPTQLSDSFSTKGKA